MSIRARLFLTFGVLVAALLLIQAVVLRNLSVEVRTGVDAVAAEASEATLEVFFATHGMERPVAVERIEQDGLIDIQVMVADGHELTFTGPDGVKTVDLMRSEDLHRTTNTFSLTLALGTMGLMAFGLVVVGVTAHRVAAPLSELAVAAAAVGDGKLGTQVKASAGGEVGQAIGAFNKMSARLEELEERNRVLQHQAQLSELGEVGRGLAHSLRNPLHAIGLAIDDLADASASSESAVAARAQIRRIDQSIRAFLVLAEDAHTASGSLDLSDLLADVELEVLQGAGTVDLEVAVEPGLTLLGVEPELRAVVQALVVNAVEASPADGAVRVSVKAHGDGVRIEVSDTGEGIAEGVRARLFQPHVTTKETGSGMGLFLARRIATARYGGSVELADRPAGGTTAIIILNDRTDGV
jgi:signal transduction histidine kinase